MNHDEKLASRPESTTPPDGTKLAELHAKLDRLGSQLPPQEPRDASGVGGDIPSMNTTPTQAEQANYITNTGCLHEVLYEGLWNDFEFRETAADWLIEHGYQIRIALTPYRLPSHLTPHNPANLPPEQITEGGKYRAWSVAEYEASSLGDGSPVKGLQMWFEHRWQEDGFTGTHPGRTYRLPATVPFPDWAEMSKAACKTCEGTGEVPCMDICPLEETQPCPDCKATAGESSAVQPAPEYRPWVTGPGADIMATMKHMETMSREFAEAWAKRISEEQPAPGDTPDTPQTDAVIRYCVHVLPKDQRFDYISGVCRTLERQRDQAREELAATEAENAVLVRRALSDPLLEITRKHWEKTEMEPLQSELANLQAQMQKEGRGDYAAGRVPEMREEIKTLQEQRGILEADLEAANADRVRLREALTGILNGAPAYHEGNFVTLHFDEAGNETGFEYHDPFVIVQGLWEIADKALSTPPPEMVMKEKYDADIAMMNERAMDRTSGMLAGQVRIQQMPSAMSFRAGWEAGMDYHDTPGAPNLEQALREHMAENEPKGMTLAELKGGEE